MKKVISRILAVVLTTILFASPVVAQAASEPVVLFNQNGLKVFQYQPDPLFLGANSTIFLEDTTTSDGQWFVPAGNKATFNYYVTDAGGYHQFRVLRVTSPYSAELVYDSGISDYKYPGVVFDALPYDTKYILVSTAYTDINIAMYEAHVRVE